MNFWRLSCDFSYRSTACPDCRANISGSKRIYLNIANHDDADESISDTVLMATLNGLSAKILQYERDIDRMQEDNFGFQTSIFVLSVQNDQKREQLRKSESTARERKRKLTALQKQLQELEKSLKSEVAYNSKLSAKLMANDRTIRDLNRAVKLMEAENANKMKLIRTENTELNEQITRLNDCIDALDMRAQFDRLMNKNRRVTRSQTVQRAKSQSSARQKK